MSDGALVIPFETCLWLNIRLNTTIKVYSREYFLLPISNPMQNTVSVLLLWSILQNLKLSSSYLFSQVSVSFLRDFTVEILDGDTNIVTYLQLPSKQPSEFYDEETYHGDQHKSSRFTSPTPVPRNRQENMVLRNEADALESFILHLRACVKNHLFDWQTFVLLNGVLRRDFIQLRGWIRDFPARDMHLETRLEFAENMLHDMESSVALIRFFNMNTTEAELLRDVIRLYVGTYTLFDVLGNPDSMAPLHANKISAFGYCLSYWEQLHGGVKNNDIMVSRQFRVFCDKIRVILKDLAASSSHEMKRSRSMTL